MGKFGRENHVKLDIFAYNHALLGMPKVGKTTLIYEVCEKEVGHDGYIFLEMGKEDGAAAIEGIVYENVPDWEYFEEIVDDIVENKESDYPNLRVIVIDTFDGFIDIAEPETINRSNKANRNKKNFEKANTINEAWGGFQRGQQKCLEMMLDALWRLKNVGVAFVIIGHVKNKENIDSVTEKTYSQLTSDVERKYFNGLMKKLHTCAIAYTDRTIETTNTGKKNIVTGKEVTKNIVTKEVRKINFRDDGFALDNGGRFAQIVSETEFSSDNYIKAIKDAIKAEQSKSGISFEVAKKKEDKEKANSKKEVAEKEKKRKESKQQLDDLKRRILSYIKENKSDISLILPIATKCKELCGSQNPEDLKTLEDAYAVYELVK